MRRGTRYASPHGNRVGRREVDEGVEEDSGQLVVNLSRRNLITVKERLLKKGLKSAVTPDRVDSKEVIADVESAIRDLTPGEKAWTRHEVAKVLKGVKSMRPNLTKEERKALDDLAGCDDIKILPADKGGTVVVMDALGYMEKLRALVTSGPYEEVRKDPGQMYRRELMELLRTAKQSGRIQTGFYNHLCPTHFQRPFLFGSPKIHKEGNPVRPIVSMVGTLFAPVSRMLAKVLAPYGKEGDSFVAHSSEVIDKIKEVEDFAERWLVSYS